MPTSAAIDQTAYQQRAHFLRLAGAEGLRREGNRAHAQEGKQPEQAVENHRCDRHAAEQCRIAEPPDRDRRDDADQGVVRLATIAGPAMAKTCAVVTLEFEVNG